MKLRTIGMSVAAALALVAGSAQAQEAGWDTKYGILFTVPNPFGGGSGTNVLNDYDGMVAGQYNLGPQAALRLSANVTRASFGGNEYTDSTGLKYNPAPTFTSFYDVTLAGQYMLRATTAAVSPYFGAGAQIDVQQTNLKGDFNTTYGGPKTKYDDYDRTWSVGLLGTAGLEWRIHKVLALFAEYRATLVVVSSTSGESKRTPSGGTTTTTKGPDETHFFNLSTGIANGGQIGLIAFF